ncbi:Stf0 sulfotransferase family protein [Solirubrobacter ginsenosidimutans]|uniref:Trehalose 2-sulfotransferase n=1 Tax=Solirubrobacter ginsenosidimutans TaxID=490573 RepID=A0A9X3MRE6_9ACTN|nr:Stf0 family sulfotransferase [Solirubrobacter ginsenosidimutans]MDA0160526.1 Stf0 sulfotransferase family protein [Solirubrobacter ginsenosidimutans]
MSGLIVCATQRSGSTLLCELLKATGVAGVPNEYFQHFKDSGIADQPRQYLAGVSDPSVLGLLPPLDPGVPETSFDFEAVRRAGTTPNGVFAAKIMWSHTPDLWVRLGERSLEDVFGPLRYVQVVRRDKVAQAVSLWTAIQTQAWRSGDSPVAEPVYSFAAIKHLTEWLAAGERGWTEWLRGRSPDVVVYEDFARDPGPTIEILAGVKAPPSPLLRQSGSRSSAWAARFASEAA